MPGPAYSNGSPSHRDAKQDKFWVEGTPSGERWEVYTVLADSQTFFGRPGEGPACCGGATAEATPASGDPMAVR